MLDLGMRDQGSGNVALPSGAGWALRHGFRRSVFDIEDRQQPVLFADRRKQLNQATHVRAIVVELLWSSLASSPGSDLIVVLGTVITLTAMFHPLAESPRRYRLASAGTRIAHFGGAA